MKKKRFLVTAFVFLAIGFFLGAYINRSNNLDEKLFLTQEKNYSKTYPHVNPLKFCDTYEENIVNNKITPLKKKVVDIISKSTHNVSVYYRSLNNGPWFVINPENIYEGKSLLKIPIAIAYFRVAESNSNILNHNLTYHNQHQDIQNTTEDESIQPESKYSVESLIDYMLIYSDNQAYQTLYDHAAIIGLKPSIDYVFNHLSTSSDYQHVNIKEYAETIRVLYNSTFLEPKYSEKILSSLAKATYRDGIVSGFPLGTEISHKFGVKTENNQDELQLHDCGVVYTEQGDHIVCIMTKGDDLESQENLIGLISKIIAEEIL